ncbi:MAG: SDR family oxidoreductase [Alcanivorax sp.]|uniref:SDR family oxidoreductase n=1 Tax=Alloalcanivorax marinus TaxID=1177169 RepID=UPI00195A376B|nr:SDR family oxidoreductase [Alloalcanivorax marinus]MBM7334646.1 SDR family oxidoreductase [Alloalcanivorax marinus]
MNRILITGAASGIGLATAQRFHARGWQVGLVDVNDNALRSVHAELGADTWFQAVDVTDPAACRAAADAFAAQAGGLDVLFNSAGLLHMGPVEEVSLLNHHRTLDINVKGVLHMSLACLPHLKRSTRPRVLNMSSASALYGVPDLAVYSASKFAVRGLTEALNLEWRRHGIVVQDLMPPFVNTPMVTGQRYRAAVVDRMGVKLNADDVARAAEQALDSGKVHTPVGLPFRVTVLLEKLAPRWVTRELMRRLSR